MYGRALSRRAPCVGDATSSQTLTWDVENHLSEVTWSGSTWTYVYDGDDRRVKKMENQRTIVYPNRYYEKDLTGQQVTTYYYLGDRLVALRKWDANEYIHQACPERSRRKHLTSSMLSTNSSGAQVSAIGYHHLALSGLAAVPRNSPCGLGNGPGSDADLSA
ncbi:MAG: hypothetical protein AB1603_01200 [Chloroflexota bacterium]